MMEALSRASSDLAGRRAARMEAGRDVGFALVVVVAVVQGQPMEDLSLLLQRIPHGPPRLQQQEVPRLLLRVGAFSLMQKNTPCFKGSWCSLAAAASESF